MHRYAKHTSVTQIPLELEPLANPTHESALRAAYGRLEISRSLTLEQAMRDTAYAIGIRNLAEAMARRGTSGYTTNGTPTTVEPAEGMDTLLAHRTGFHYPANAKGDR